jgi:hypothetical protein
MNADPLRLGARVLTALPDVGGFVGGLAPGPLGIAGAGLLGGAGEAVKEVGMGRRPDLGKIGQAGAGQAALTAVGMGLGSAAGRIGTGLVKAAIGRPAKNVAKKVAKRGLEAAEKTIVRRKLANEEMAETAIKESDRILNQTLTRAKNAGVQFDPGDIARSVFDKIEQSRRYKIGAEDKKKLSQMTEEFLADHPDMLDPQALQALKQRFGDLVFKGKADPQARYSLTTEFNDAIRAAAKQALEGRRALAGSAEARVLKPVQGINRETEALMRARDALGDMGTRPALRPFGAMGGGLNVPFVGGSVRVPRELALRAGLASAQSAPLARMSPRLLEALYQQSTLEE